MSRLTITLTAAAASALVAAATVALPAIGDDSTDGSAGPAGLAACLRSHGLDGAPDDPVALKPWIAQRHADDPVAVDKAMDACQEQQTPQKRELTGPDVQKLVACLRANGLDAPSDPAQLKRWLGEKKQSDTDALERVMPRCKMALDPEAGKAAPKPGGCGDDATKPGDPATKPDEPATKPDEPTT